MFAFTELFKKHLEIGSLKLNKPENILKSKVWARENSSNGKEEVFSPKNVIDNPKKYVSDFKRIQAADLAFPVFLHNGIIVDGYHRATKAALNGISEIKAYNFDNALMKKFRIGRNTKADWEKTTQLPLDDFMEMFFDRFCCSKTQKCT